MGPQRRHIEAYLEASCRRSALPELALAIHADGAEVEVFETPPPRSAPALYKVGSLTKVVTALAVLLLQEDGALKLSDAVSTHLPWFHFRPVTIRDLLVHTSGLPRGDFFNVNPSLEQVKRSLEPVDRVSPGARQVKYSNLGYILAGLIVEAVVRMPYASFVERRLLVPLGMCHSGFDLDRDAVAMTTPHRLRCFLPDSVTPYDLDEMPLYSAPHAALDMFSTVTDFSRLVSCLLNDGVLDGERILSHAAVSALLATRHPAKGQSSAGPGFHVRSTANEDVFFEGAEHFGHSASFRFVPARRFALIAMTNRGSAGLDLAGMLETLDRYYTEGRRANVLNHDYGDSDSVTGSYEAENGSTLTIRSCGRQLMIAMEGEEESLLIYSGHGCFLKLAGSCTRYVFRPHCQSGEIRGLCAGPFYFRKRPYAPDPPGGVRHPGIAGVYRNRTVGRVVLFERNHQLVLAYSPLKEAVLEEVSPDTFLQRSGPFADETVMIDRGERILRLGRLIFHATGEQY